MRELLFNGYSISACNDEKVLEMDSSDGHNNIKYLTPLNCILKLFNW